MITSTVLIVGLIACYVYAPAWVFSLILIGVLLFVLRTEWPLFRLPWLTPLYPILPFLLLVALNQGAMRLLLSLLLVTVSSYDAGAFLAGKQWGRYKLCPAISPQKTWEGVVGGFVAALCGSEIFLASSGHPSSLGAIFIFCLMICTAATAGDLFESYLKRRVGLKDAGSLLPGHGGFLDRIDGVLGAIMLVYPLRWYFARLLGFD